MADDVGVKTSPWVRLRDYFAAVKIEMKRVTWPGWPEVYGTTVMVVLTTFAFGFYFWACDLAFRNLVAKVLRYFLHRG